MIVLFLIAFGSLNRVGIIGAMDEELNLIKKEIVIEQVDTIAERVFTQGKIKGLPVVLVRAGVGKVNAATTAEILVYSFKTDLVIFTGVAGGVNPKLGIGDIVISERVIHHDYGLITPDKFSPFDTTGFFANRQLIVLAVAAVKQVAFSAIPEEITKKPPRIPVYLLGRIVTGDQFIASEEKRQWLEKTFRADCVEMEGAAVAQVCTMHKVPFVIIRCLSDLANEKADVDFDKFVGYAAKNSSSIVLEMIREMKRD